MDWVEFEHRRSDGKCANQKWAKESALVEKALMQMNPRMDRDGLRMEIAHHSGYFRMHRPMKVRYPKHVRK